jgi:2-amino-4-hydroxy-6-hydroxymethyldihydropteridine diphosphokinase
MSKDQIGIKRLRVRGVIGLHDRERMKKQDILVSVKLYLNLKDAGLRDKVDSSVNYSTLISQITTHVESSQRFTVEALATDVAGICLAIKGVVRVRTRIEKPMAVKTAEAVGVVIERVADDLIEDALISIGSNVDPEVHLCSAVRQLKALGHLAGVSEVYQTRAVGDQRQQQPQYLNAAAAVRTCLPAGEVRRRLKTIQTRLGRSPQNDRNQPVPIDLDLCLLGDQVIDAEDVTIPDSEIVKREYLAVTLAQLRPSLRHPLTGQTLAQIAAELKGSSEIRLRDDVRLVEAYTC